MSVLRRKSGGVGARMVLTIVALILAAPGVGLTDSAPDLGRPFAVRPLPPALYEVQAPNDANGQRHLVTASDGVEIFTETWLPAARGANVPPARLPTIVVITPYTHPGATGGSTDIRDVMVPRGYAFTVAHVRGTGGSGGCLDYFGPQEADDSARVIEYVGRDAPWSNGIVGGFGLSYYGGTLVHAVSRGEPSRVGYLRAMVLIAPGLDAYQNHWIFDGVKSFVQTETTYLGQESSNDIIPRGLEARYAARSSCWHEHAPHGLTRSADFTPYFVQRDARRWVENIRAATLVFHGHADINPSNGVPPMEEVGFFERLPSSTLKAGVFGVFGHERTSEHSISGVQPDWERRDFYEMVAAWFDRYLRGESSGADAWPTAQVQGTDGQWRAEPEWPTTGGPVGHLALGPDGTLGSDAPHGSTRYVEAGFETTRGAAPGTYAVFETPPLSRRVELTGQPVLDLWVVLGRDDAHIAARIDTFDADGQPIEAGVTYGLRSARHLQPLVENRFEQSRSEPPPLGVPLRIPVRFQPTGLVIPPGGTLRLTIAGSLIIGPGLQGPGIPEPLFLGPSEPSFAFTPVTILHECAHLSALRFLMPRENPDLLNVREKDEPADQPLADNRPFVAPVSDGGGLATAPVCGRAPIRLENFGPEIP